MVRACVFDVNETLLDLGALDPRFESVFGDAAVRREWFLQMLQNAFVATITDTYSDFGALGGAALTMVAERRGMDLSDEDSQHILSGMRELPPHPEAEEGLRRLKSAGFRLAALTNSTRQVAEAQLEYSRLDGYFERILSADTVQRLKPAPEPYRMAAESLGVNVNGIRLIAAHAWDVAGALRAGCAAAFVARPGMVFDPLVQPPDVMGTSLLKVADRIIEAEAHDSTSPQDRLDES